MFQFSKILIADTMTFMSHVSYQVGVAQIAITINNLMDTDMVILLSYV